MILSAQSIRNRVGMIKPFEEKNETNGLSFGLSSAGYDIRSAQYCEVPVGSLRLISSVEYFNIPLDLVMRIIDKSTWARLGLFVQNTVAEPGWRGYLTLEITNNSHKFLTIHSGDPIAQVMFELLDQATELPYDGKYQDQPSHPVEALR